MNKIRKILFPTDFSDTARNAFLHCLLLAKEMEASITLLHAIYPEYETLDLPVVAAKATKDKIEAARITLQSFRDYGLAEAQKRHKVDSLPTITTEVEIGGAVSVIGNVARRDEVDLIILGSSDDHDVVEKTFGSVTTGILDRVNCPVMIIPEEAPYHRFDVVAYATDLDEAAPFHLWKAGRLLEAFNSVLHVVHIDTGDNVSNGLTFAEMEEFFAEKAPALQVRFHDIKDDSVEEGLEEFINVHDIHLLIMYAPHHSLLERIFTRSRTKRMAMRTHVPLLLVKQ